MKLRDARDYYQSGTQDVNTLTEKLLFAGVGTVLVLSGGLGAASMTIDVPLKFALFFFIAGLGAALGQYITKAQKWKKFFDGAEADRERVPEDLPEGVSDHLDLSIGAAPEDFNDVLWRFWWVRVGCTTAGWLLVCWVFVTRVS